VPSIRVASLTDLDALVILEKEIFDVDRLTRRSYRSCWLERLRWYWSSSWTGPSPLLPSSCSIVRHRLPACTRLPSDGRIAVEVLHVYYSLLLIAQLWHEAADC
jgi:hypothetical protein